MVSASLSRQMPVKRKTFTFVISSLDPELNSRIMFFVFFPTEQTSVKANEMAQ